MNKPLLSVITLLILLTINALSHAGPAGLINKASKFNTNETINRLEAALKKKGITVVTRWNHSERAKEIGITLRPTELIIFGNPELGSQFFTSQQTSGIDLPMKALAWEDETGQVWLSYNDPSFITSRHNIKDRDNVSKKMKNALHNLTNIATGNKN
ncbi:MAG: DUF302 domain-containing protein [Gammaproteobacteria bacterium]|nr:DUF302 domain-containing protein [Gammaproteobacteria bacterium]